MPLTAGLAPGAVATGLEPDYIPVHGQDDSQLYPLALDLAIRMFKPLLVTPPVTTATTRPLGEIKNDVGSSWTPYESPICPEGSAIVGQVTPILAW